MKEEEQSVWETPMMDELLIRFLQHLKLITRVIPRSLANLVKKHDVEYPISKDRFSEVR